MEYPFLLGGRRSGSCIVEQEGLFTVFELNCELYDALPRVSVYGQGKEGYLGLMQPWKGGLYLRRRFSRSALAAFPREIEYAAPAGLSHSPPDSLEAAPAPEEEASQSGVEASGEDSSPWFRRADGSLICRDGEGFVVALPSRLRRPAPGASIKEIDGQLYMLFRY